MERTEQNRQRKPHKQRPQRKVASDSGRASGGDLGESGRGRAVAGQELEPVGARRAGEAGSGMSGRQEDAWWLAAGAPGLYVQGQPTGRQNGQSSQGTWSQLEAEASCLKPSREALRGR